jgi:hypothetical protein
MISVLFSNHYRDIHWVPYFSSHFHSIRFPCEKNPKSEKIEIARIKMAGGDVERYWYLPGMFSVDILASFSRNLNTKQVFGDHLYEFAV